MPPGQTALGVAAGWGRGACQAGPVTGITIRDAAASDIEAIAGIALATGQDEEWSGSDPAYVRHLLAHGRLVVAEYRGAVGGFGATHRIGAGPAAITMLCDLFVDPDCHGLGLGRAMLEVLWHDGTPRMTFPRAAPRTIAMRAEDRKKVPSQKLRHKSDASSERNSIEIPRMMSSHKTIIRGI